jgi:uncharacterized protein involved in type VI secretion and phage assembly
MSASPPKPKPGKYLGKYRGTVFNNIDPLQMGRIQIMVPDVAGFIPSTWALPCLPLAGMLQGFFTLPMIGSGVWVEFEQGDPDFPIWVGGFWGSMAEVPPMAKLVPPAVPGITIQTPLQNSIQISDVPGVGGIMLKTTTGASIIINDLGIVIQNGKGASIALAGPSVTINQGALVVM